MRRILIVGLGLLASVGCVNHTDRIDLSRIEGGEGFEWDGRVAVHQDYQGILVGYRADFVKLKSRDGRELIIHIHDGHVSAVVDATNTPANSKSKAAVDTQPSVE